MSICFLFFSDDEGEELFYKRGTEFKLPYPCLYDFDTNFNSNLNEEENYSLKHHSSSLMKTSNINSSLPISTNSRPTKKIPKTTTTTTKQPSIHPFPSNSSSTPSSFDPYYNSYPSTYVSSYPTDVTTASFIEAAATNYSTNPNNSE